MKIATLILWILLTVACSHSPSVASPTPLIAVDACTALDTSSGQAPNFHQVTYCVLNPNVTQETINTTICVSGWTSTIRPSTSYTEPIKLRLISEGQNTIHGVDGYGNPWENTNPSDYELDHRMPLELGGAPKDINNLSIEYPRSVNAKDLEENHLKKLVCSGQTSLMAAQIFLSYTWLGTYPNYLK